MPVEILNLYKKIYIYIYTLIKVYTFHTKKCGRESFAFVSSSVFFPSAHPFVGNEVKSARYFANIGSSVTHSN